MIELNKPTTEGNLKVLLERISELEDALRPFALCNPAKMGSMPDEEHWLWKPNRTSVDEPGITRADIMKAKYVLNS